MGELHKEGHSGLYTVHNTLYNHDQRTHYRYLKQTFNILVDQVIKSSQYHNPSLKKNVLTSGDLVTMWLVFKLTWQIIPIPDNLAS